MELAVEPQVHQPLGTFSGRLKDVATTRRSQVPLMMFSTATEAQEQLRAELGKLAGGVMNPNIPSIEQLKEIAPPAPVSYAPQMGLVGVAGLLVLVFCWSRGGIGSGGGSLSARGVGAIGRTAAAHNDRCAELPELLKRVALFMLSLWTHPVERACSRWRRPVKSC